MKVYLYMISTLAHLQREVYIYFTEGNYELMPLITTWLIHISHNMAKHSHMQHTHTHTHIVFQVFIIAF